MVEVKEKTEVKTSLIYETATHKYRIDEEKLYKLKEDNSKLQSSIQKGMKQTTEVGSAEFWDESWKSIFRKILGMSEEEVF